MMLFIDCILSVGNVGGSVNKFMQVFGIRKKKCF